MLFFYFLFVFKTGEMSKLGYHCTPWFAIRGTLDNMQCLSQLLENEDIFDINFGISSKFLNSMMHVAGDWEGGFDRDEPHDCSVWDYIKEILTKCKNFDLNATNFYGQSIFCTLLSYKLIYFKDIVEMCKQGKLACKWNINDLTKHITIENDNLLSYAITNGNNVETIKYLLELNVFSKEDIVSRKYGLFDGCLINICAYCISGMNNQSNGIEKCNNYLIFELLLKQDGINPYQKNKYGYDTFDLLKKRGKHEYLQLLNQWVKRAK